MKIYKTFGMFFRIGDQNVRSSKGLYFNPEVATSHNQRFLEETAEENEIPLDEIKGISLQQLQENPGFVPGPGVIAETHCQYGDFRWILRVAETTVNNETKPQE